jgi:hypothetical protein
VSNKNTRLSAVEHTIQALFIGRGRFSIMRVENQIWLFVGNNDLETAQKYSLLVGRRHRVKIAVGLASACR